MTEQGAGTVVRSNHVGFTVRALDRPIEMFTELFGYALESIGGRDPAGVARLTGISDADITVAHLRRPGFIGVELIAYATPRDAGKIEGRPCDSGFTHLTFDVDGLDAIVSAGAVYGLLPIGELVGDRAGTRRSARVVYLRDPDGIAIELIQAARVT